MTINPYLSDDDDADLFNTPSSNSEPNQRVTKNYEFVGANGEPLPKEMEEALSEHVAHAVTGHGARSNIPLYLQACSAVLESFSENTRSGSHGGLITAMAELLDEMSDGKLSAIYAYNESRRKLYALHMNKRIANWIFEMFASSRTTAESEEIRSYVDTFNNLNEFMLSRAIQEYRYFCEELKRPVDESIIDCGRSSSRGQWEKVGLSMPPAFEEELYGSTH